MLRGLLLVLVVVVGVWLVAILLLLALGPKSRARELARLIPNLVVLFRGVASAIPESRGGARGGCGWLSPGSCRLVT